MKVNGKVYDWADVDFKVPGLDIEVQEISYDDELDQEAVYGKGTNPRLRHRQLLQLRQDLPCSASDYTSCWPMQGQGRHFFKLQFPSVVVSYGMEGEKTVSMS